MKYILLTLLLFTANVNAGGQQMVQDLRNTEEVSRRCMENIEYFQDKISRYSLKLHLNLGEKIKLDYYKRELDAWQNYCYNGSADPDFN